MSDRSRARSAVVLRRYLGVHNIRLQDDQFQTAQPRDLARPGGGLPSRDQRILIVEHVKITKFPSLSENLRNGRDHNPADVVQSDSIDWGFALIAGDEVNRG